MKKGDYIYTAISCHVKIAEVFGSEKEARNAGYIEPTGFQSGGYGVLYKNTGEGMRVFAGYKMAA